MKLKPLDSLILAISLVVLIDRGSIDGNGALDRSHSSLDFPQLLFVLNNCLLFNDLLYFHELYLVTRSVGITIKAERPLIP